MSKHLDAKFDLPISEQEELLKKIRSYLHLAKFLFYVNVIILLASLFRWYGVRVYIDLGGIANNAAGMMKALVSVCLYSIEVLELRWLQKGGLGWTRSEKGKGVDIFEIEEMRSRCP
jgi:hypothetical protein